MIMERVIPGALFIQTDRWGVVLRAAAAGGKAIAIAFLRRRLMFARPSRELANERRLKSAFSFDKRKQNRASFSFTRRQLFSARECNRMRKPVVNCISVLFLFYFFYYWLSFSRVVISPQYIFRSSQTAVNSYC